MFIGGVEGNRWIEKIEGVREWGGEYGKGWDGIKNTVESFPMTEG